MVYSLDGGTVFLIAVFYIMLNQNQCVRCKVLPCNKATRSKQRSVYFGDLFTCISSEKRYLWFCPTGIITDVTRPTETGLDQKKYVCWIDAVVSSLYVQYIRTQKYDIFEFKKNKIIMISKIESLSVKSNFFMANLVFMLNLLIFTPDYVSVAKILRE